MLKLLGWIVPSVLAVLAHASGSEATKKSSANIWEPYFSLYEGEVGTQQVFSSGPLANFSALSYSGYTTLKHTAFPRYGVRVKKSQFCDGTVECVMHCRCFLSRSC